MRKRLRAQVGARKKQGVSADVETLDDDLEYVLQPHIENLERQIETIFAQVEAFSTKANLLRSIPKIWSHLCGDVDRRIA
ncbi:hypothetical protein SAMN06295998_12430 [Primorskyibacter flagellatus]|uniref:Uncharacterized protein n=2 Tax=Primorskyibacter flagellatus TaxID=1387277 RepID=A0A1W2E9H9_9RHOB|nr:hypothetical protein SAMN06295998_12430 [Primorskyibacter flagellatus]